jgi:hypothetical protein
MTTVLEGANVRYPVGDESDVCFTCSTCSVCDDVFKVVDVGCRLTCLEWVFASTIASIQNGGKARGNTTFEKLCEKDLEGVVLTPQRIVQ